MIILLKIILGLFSVADLFAAWQIFKDFRSTRSQDGYDELSIWKRIKFNVISFFVITSMISLFVFLVYFIFIKISLG